MGRGKLFVTLVTAIAMVAFCGEGVAQEPPTRAQYVERAEEVCETSKERTEPVLDGVGSDIQHDRLNAAGRALSKASRLFARERQRLVRIPKPPGDAKVLTVWLNRLDVQNSLMATAGRLMLEGRRQKVTGYLARYAHAGNLANDTVLGFGFDKCLFRFAKLPKA
jgi:hypothetical protein